jgi:integrase
MSVTVRQRGDSWQALVRIRAKGEKFEKSRTFQTERLARDWGHRLDKEVKATGIPQRELATGTLGQLLEDYATALQKIRPLRKQRERELERLQGEDVAKKKLRDLRPADFTKLADLRRKRDGAGPATILQDLAVYRAVLGAAKPMFNLDISGSVVGDAIKTLRNAGVVADSAQRSRRPSQKELDDLERDFERLGRHPSTTIDMVSFMRIAIALPRRRGELCTMRWEDYAGTTILLRDTKHPTKIKNEVVPVPAEAAAIIDRQPKVSEYIFPYKPESVSASFQRACKRLGIEDLHLHDLRHEGISRLFEAGLQIQEVALISGHESWTQLKRYTQIKPEHVLERLNHGRDGKVRPEPDVLQQRPGGVR